MKIHHKQTINECVCTLFCGGFAKCGNHMCVYYVEVEMELLNHNGICESKKNCGQTKLRFYETINGVGGHAARELRWF